MVAQVLAWLQALPQPELVGATGGLVFLESTIGLGLFVPGESGLLIAGTTAVTVPRFLVLWAVVAVCATCGDSLGYAIGHRWGPRLRDTRLVQRHGLDAWDRATGVLRRRGAWAVFFARFLPVVRAFVPAAAGSSGLPFRKFLPAAASGALCWSALHVSLGLALGEAAERIESILSTSGFVVLCVFVAVGVFLLVRRRKKAAATRL